MFYTIGEQDFKKYIDYLKNTIEIYQNLSGIINFPLLEELLYIDDFLRSTSSKEEVMANILLGVNNKGPYARIADDYLRERILGTLEKDMQLYEGNLQEYFQARDNGQRPMYLKLKKIGSWESKNQALDNDVALNGDDAEAQGGDVLLNELLKNEAKKNMTWWKRLRMNIPFLNRT